MELTKLRNEQIQLFKFMEKGGYSERYICAVKKELKRLLQYGDSYDNYFDTSTIQDLLYFSDHYEF